MALEDQQILIKSPQASSSQGELEEAASVFGEGHAIIVPKTEDFHRLAGPWWTWGRWWPWIGGRGAVM